MTLLLTDVQKTTTIQFGSVPVTDGYGNEWRSIYYLPVYNAVAGEVIQVYSDGQVGNDLGYRVELAQCIEFRTSVSGGNEPLYTVGGYTSPINGWDFSTSDQHYGRFSKMDSYTIPADISVLYLVMRIRCRSSGATSGAAVTVYPGQGLMFYNRYTPQ